MTLRFESLLSKKWQIFQLLSKRDLEMMAWNRFVQSYGLHHVFPPRLWQVRVCIEDPSSTAVCCWGVIKSRSAHHSVQLRTEWKNGEVDLEDSDGVYFTSEITHAWKQKHTGCLIVVAWDAMEAARNGPR